MNIKERIHILSIPSHWSLSVFDIKGVPFYFLKKCSTLATVTNRESLRLIKEESFQKKREEREIQREGAERKIERKERGKCLKILLLIVIWLEMTYKLSLLLLLLMRL